MPFPIPVELVGSMPRPLALQKLYADYDNGKATLEELEQAQDDAAKDTIERIQKTGIPVATDGEQRSSSFATYPVTTTLNGTGLAPGLEPNGQYFAIFDDGHHRQLPRITQGPFRYQTYAADNFKKSIKYANGGPLKTAVIAPSMMYLLYPLDASVPGYTRDKFGEDIVNEAERDIRLAFEAGAVRVSVDFTEGRLAAKNDPRNPWTGRKMLQTFIDLNNKVLDRFNPQERKNIGVHTCPGGDCDSVHSYDVDYAELLPSIFKINAGYFLIQAASEKNKPYVYELIGKHIRSDADGVKQVAFIGVIDPLNPTIETPEQVATDLELASKYIDKTQLGATVDCGFSPFSIDAKPKHGSPDFARDIAIKKIESLVAGAKLAEKRIG